MFVNKKNDTDDKKNACYMYYDIGILHVVSYHRCMPSTNCRPRKMRP